MRRMVLTDKITVYHNGKLVFGIEPDGTSPDTSEPTEEDLPALKGDVNLDGKISSADIVAINKYLLNLNAISEEAFNYNSDKAVNVFDSIGIRKLILNK